MAGWNLRHMFVQFFALQAETKTNSLEADLESRTQENHSENHESFC